MLQPSQVRRQGARRTRRPIQVPALRRRRAGSTTNAALGPLVRTQQGDDVMATFKDTHEVYAVQGGFLDWITKDEILRPKFVKANTSFMVNYSDPEARILVDCTQDPPVVVCDPPADTAAEIDLKMGADEGHAFWQGKLNLTAAMARRKV